MSILGMLNAEALAQKKIKTTKTNLCMISENKEQSKLFVGGGGNQSVGMATVAGHGLLVEWMHIQGHWVAAG